MTGRLDLRQSSQRVDDLAARYTARELALLATDFEAQLVRVRVTLGLRTEALHEIARGGWTAEGAQEIAKEALCPK